MILSLIIAAAESAGHASATASVDWASIGNFVCKSASVVTILAGLFFVFAGTIGVLRLPDFFTRIHSAGMTDTMGAELIIIGLMIQSGFTQMSLKLFLVAILLLITGPTATHAVANAAHNAGLKPLLGIYRAPDLSEETSS